MSISNETLMAYADGELDASARAAVEAAICADPEIARRVAQYRDQREKLRAAYEAELADPVPERLLAVLRGRRSARQVRSRWRYPAALAASVVAAIGLAMFAWQRPALVWERGGTLVASGALARDLTDSLAGDQAAGDVRLGISFRARTGDYCRTFTLRQSAGLACRKGDRWLIRDFTEVGESGAPQSGEYRAAASSLPPAILAAVRDAIVGEPLDRAGEQNARKSGWRPPASAEPR
jgi:hypothetical protein